VYNITALPTIAPTSIPSSIPTFIPSSSPSVLPTTAPTSSPTLTPTYVPSLSMFPSNALEIGISFSVTQILVDVDYDTYLTYGKVSETKFISSLVEVVPDLKMKEIDVISTQPLMTTSTSTDTSFSSSLLRLSSSYQQRRRMSLSEIILIYNVTHLVIEDSETTSLETVYNNLINEITNVSTGTTSTLAIALRSSGAPYLSTTMTDIPPDITTYTVYTQHSPYPTTIPTSAPSCGIGSEGSGGENCQKCHPGTYREFDDEECKECDLGTYCDMDGCESCENCPYPWTTTKTGQTKCTAIQLHIPGILVYTILIVIIVFYFVIIFMTSTAKLACLAIMTLPLFDILTDILYLALSPFYGLEPFIACSVILTIIPILVFIGIILQQKAKPRIFGQQYLTILFFLNKSTISGYPTANNIEIFKPFIVHDSIPKIFYFALCWGLAVLGQVIALLPAAFVLLLHLPIWFGWLLIGTFLYQSKILSIGIIWNLWFSFWTGTTTGNYFTVMAIDTRVFNKSLLTEFLFESLPQLSIQAYNNTQLQKWSLLSYISTIFSLFMTLDGIWRISYYKIYNGISFRDIPVGMGIIKINPDSQMNQLLNIIKNSNHDSFQMNGCIEAAERVVSSAPPLNDSGL
jgi:hypothetical protein